MPIEGKMSNENHHYHGWLRLTGAKWTLACTAPTERECWRLLIAHKASGNCERAVTRGGEPPREGRRQ